MIQWGWVSEAEENDQDKQEEPSGLEKIVVKAMTETAMIKIPRLFFPKRASAMWPPSKEPATTEGG